MIEFSKIQINACYNIETIAPNLLGSSYRNLRVKAIFSTDEAIKRNVDVYNLHNNIKQLSNAHLPTSADDCDYILFEDDRKTEIIVAYQYLSDIRPVLTSTLVITIPNYTGYDAAMIERQLRKLGYDNFTIERK